MSENTGANTIHYRYRFTFADGTEKDFDLHLNPSTLELITTKDAVRPEWTRLKYFQCDNCPLGDEVEYCPVAVNLATLIDAFKDAVSFTTTGMTVEAAERIYHRETTLQKGLSSIIGIYMVTSNCPVMDKLRPNVRFHLPFASTEETVYRAISMYLTAQYFVMRKGGKPDWGLQNLAEIYKAVAHVNQGISQRLVHASREDANVNAVIILSTFGATLDHFLENSLNSIEYMFRDYIPPA
jgi:hypothetical protein